MNKLFVGIALAASFALPASAQSVKSEVTATNGVVVTVYSDDFANRYEYSAPVINFPDGYALVARIVRPGITPKTNIQGSLSYRGEWRRYSTALFRGGAEASYNAGSREVVSCSGSRYGGGCNLREGFSIDLAPAQIRDHTQDGVIDIQVRAQDTSTALIKIPASYIEAVNEVAGHRSSAK
ncbi:hypothetical protein HNP32_001708 [Brevundimonas bullata]|uniref:Uncharacterized protein n=1 Tax=Brevundimonas bullata TaxID=13160 RepID=A0A7W7IP81_9CAUL|nr:hypothetical protein [Brevundimonas bullata]MBB4797984.1 hypothetical protein [Brevundimonas bullata]MBB6382943.1 hypothetical protein [Brevundimonas bullata]MBD3833814.1 hypothetical protein [Brevundimonas sp.]